MTHYPTSLTSTQRVLLLSAIGDDVPTFRKYSLSQVVDALLYLVKTGCQWRMLPSEFPNWRTVYHHFRSWMQKDVFSRLLDSLVRGRRAAIGLDPAPSCAVLDSESVRACLPQSEKGIDGNKKVKGIKRQLMTDMNGYPLMAHCTTANCHDSKGAAPLIEQVPLSYPTVKEIRADKGYRGCLAHLSGKASEIDIICVKSNFGTSEFKPLDGRWVVERTFSWLSNYRRLTRNYERRLATARQMLLLGCVAFMLRFF